jgi:hypothetical protein
VGAVGCNPMSGPHLLPNRPITRGNKFLRIVQSYGFECSACKVQQAQRESFKCSQVEILSSRKNRFWDCARSSSVSIGYGATIQYLNFLARILVAGHLSKQKCTTVVDVGN